MDKGSATDELSRRLELASNRLEQKKRELRNTESDLKNAMHNLAKTGGHLRVALERINQLEAQIKSLTETPY